MVVKRTLISDRLKEGNEHYKETDYEGWREWRIQSLIDRMGIGYSTRKSRKELEELQKEVISQ